MFGAIFLGADSVGASLAETWHHAQNQLRRAHTHEKQSSWTIIANYRIGVGRQ
jgi:hypothetical protein